MKKATFLSKIIVFTFILVLVLSACVSQPEPTEAPAEPDVEEPAEPEEPEEPAEMVDVVKAVSYTHLTLPTTPYV